MFNPIRFNAIADSKDKIQRNYSGFIGTILNLKIDESEKRRLELEIMEAEQKQREEALKLQLQELMEQRERLLAEQQATSRDYRRDRRRAGSLQRQKREVSPEYLAETRQRNQEREHMREEERRKEVENVRQAFGLDKTATHPKPNNWADLIDNDSDAYDETLPPPPPNPADLIDSSDGIVELGVADIRIEEVSKTGPWVAPRPIPRLIETVPTPMPGQLRGLPRVLVEGTGIVDGKRPCNALSKNPLYLSKVSSNSLFSNIYEDSCKRFLVNLTIA